MSFPNSKRSIVVLPQFAFVDACVSRDASKEVAQRNRYDTLAINMGDALLATAPLQREDKSLIESRLRTLKFRGIETVKLLEVTFVPFAGFTLDQRGISRAQANLRNLTVHPSARTQSRGSRRSRCSRIAFARGAPIESIGNGPWRSPSCRTPCSALCFWRSDNASCMNRLNTKS